MGNCEDGCILPVETAPASAAFTFTNSHGCIITTLLMMNLQASSRRINGFHRHPSRFALSDGTGKDGHRQLYLGTYVCMYIHTKYIPTPDVAADPSSESIAQAPLPPSCPVKPALVPLFPTSVVKERKETEINRRVHVQMREVREMESAVARDLDFTCRQYGDNVLQRVGVWEFKAREFEAREPSSSRPWIVYVSTIPLPFSAPSSAETLFPPADAEVVAPKASSMAAHGGTHATRSTTLRHP